MTSFSLARDDRQARTAHSTALTDRWRTWATCNPVFAALLSGLVATHISSIIGFWLGDFGLQRLDYNIANGAVYLPNASPLSQFLYGGLMHYTDGAVFGVLFAVTLHPRLPWAYSRTGNVLKGLVFGTILAIVALAIMTPLVYAPARGNHAGFFGIDYGWKYIVSTLIFHWVYGAHLGLLYSPFGASRGDRAPREGVAEGA